MRSMLSLGSSRTKLSNMSSFVKHHAVIGANTHASFHVYPQRRPIAFDRLDLQLLSQMKSVVHDNLNPFLGMSFNERADEVVLLWKFCSRGTIQDIIYNEEVVLDERFHAAFVRDITLGLEYLHFSAIGYHGSLTPWSCLIDRNWMVKLTDYGIANPIDRWEKQGIISKEVLKESDDKSMSEKSGSQQATSVIYMAPELLQNLESNRRRGMDQSWLKQTQVRRQSGDIYSFGMVMYEILFRALPFTNTTDVIARAARSRRDKDDQRNADATEDCTNRKKIDDLVEYIRDGSKLMRPTIQHNSDLHPDLCALLQDCWNTNPEIRPSIRRVRLNTERYLKVKGSLVDQMMRMMEQYANNLEKLVRERTGLLEEANVRADRLLAQLLPRYVANELKMGRSVSPKTFDHATVMFSDIVGFTTLCGQSTPLEVVTMLNALYTGFDDVINRFGAYKVETIGDAYMVVSGLPEENGTLHLLNVALVTLHLVVFLSDFEVPHARQRRVRCRFGAHSGPVAAGVVGISTPRYCLFGDTVNVASRMESTGEPSRVQITEHYAKQLLKHYPFCKTELRGVVHVKGKGDCTTHWLVSAQPT